MPPKKKKKTTLQQRLSGIVSVGDLLDNISFQDEEVVQAAMVQPKLYLEACRLRVQKMRARMQLDSMLRVKEADVELRIRKWYTDRSKDKPTESHIKAKISKDKPLQELTKRRQEVFQEEEFCKLLVEAFRMRMSALKVVGEFIRSEVGRTDPTLAGTLQSKRSVESMREKLKRKYPGKVRTSESKSVRRK
jgi:hypothetical protein